MQSRTPRLSALLLAATLSPGLTVHALHVNYQVRVDQVRHFEGGFGGPCEELGIEEYTAIVSAFDNTGVGGTSNSSCLTVDIGGDVITFPSEIFRTMTGSAATNITIGIFAFEDDLGDRCTFDATDGCLLSDPALASIDFRAGPTNYTFYGPYGDGSHDVVVSIQWSYVVPNGFTEIFAEGVETNDLDFKTVTFTPDGSSEGYTACMQPAAQFITDPSGGAALSLSDDSFAEVTSTMGQVLLYGISYSNLFIGSNGYITFGSGTNTFEESTAAHFSLPRVSALFDDLIPESGGTVSWQDLADRVVVTYQDVPEFGVINTNSMQVELLFDGRIRITWLDIAAQDGLAGLSAGVGEPSPFVETDLSGLTACPTFSAMPFMPVHANVAVPGNSGILVNFSQSPVASSVNSASFKVWGEQTGFYAGMYDFSACSICGDFYASSTFKPGEEIIVMLNSGILSTGGLVLDPFQYQFTVAAFGCTNFLFYDSGQELGNGVANDGLLGDVDGDGDLDLVVVHQGGAHRVYANDGTGAFAESALIPHGDFGQFGDLGDLDTDGDLDLVVANGFDFPNRVYLNDGAGSFSDTGQSLGADTTSVLALGDLDGDGDLDHVVGNFSAPARTYLNDGNGQFTNGQDLESGNTFGLALGDLNGDGDLDIVTGRSTGSSRVYLNNGAGAFTTNQSLFIASCNRIALGNVDGDGDLDLVAGRFNAPTEVYMNDGSGTFSLHQSLGSNAAVDVALGDLDGDGDLDLVNGNDEQPIRIYLNDGSGAFTTNASIGTLVTRSVALGDVNGDGDVDLVETRQFDESRVLMNISCPDDGDDDTDGIPTPVEIALGFNPANPADAEADDDTDDQTVLEEYIAGTEWTNGMSYFKIQETLFSANPGEPAFRFNAVSGRVYSLEYRDDLIDPPDWESAGSILSTTTATNTFIIIDEFSPDQRSWRLKVNLAP